MVSVVIPAYNAERFIRRSIESVLTQTYRALELIVVDDGSTDRTSEVARAAADARTAVVSQPNRGVANARNGGLQRARGGFVAFLDADDHWYPTKLAVQVAALEGRPELVAVGCRMHYISTAGRVLGVIGEAVGPEQQRLVAQGRLAPFHVASSALFRRAPLVAVGGFDEELQAIVPGQVEDRELIARAAALGPIECVPDVLGAYRIHAGSASARHYLSQCQGVRFVVERLAAERRGESLSWDDFVTAQPRKLRQVRSDVAAFRYRQAGLAAADRAWLRAALHLAAAGGLAPIRTGRRLVRQRVWSGLSPVPSRVEP